MSTTSHALVIGGTRNLGPGLVAALLEAGHRVAVLNRGRTPEAAPLPAGVERLRADRADAAQLAAALGRRAFDLVVDTTLYTGPEARTTIAALDGRVGHYVVLSTGQVYLVRRGVARPFREADYAGPVMPEPPRDGPDHGDWTYGVEKRDAEDACAEAWAARRFPYTALRLPMINSELDHYDRLRNYLARLDDGGPILVPDAPDLPLRHVYGGDVVRAILRVAALGARTHGEAYNVSQDETLGLDAFLAILGEITGREVVARRVPRALLEARGLLPACSPFSGRWMSELDNRRSREELGFAYTPLREYLARLVEWQRAHPERAASSVPGYAQRPVELALEGHSAGR